MRQIGKQDDEFLATNFDSDSEDECVSSDEDDDNGNDDDEMQKVVTIFNSVETFHLCLLGMSVYCLTSEIWIYSNFWNLKPGMVIILFFLNESLFCTIY